MDTAAKGYYAIFGLGAEFEVHSVCNASLRSKIQMITLVASATAPSKKAPDSEFQKAITADLRTRIKKEMEKYEIRHRQGTMLDEITGTDRLDAAGETVTVVKYKDPYTFLCSTRWRICAYIFLSFTLLYMHRVNLSLAVVCMVDTTGSYTASLHINNSEIEANYSVIQPANNSEERLLHIHSNNLTSSNISIQNDAPYNAESGTFARNIETESITQCGSVMSKDNMDWTPELQWKKSEISALLSSYFYGSFFTQIPAGTIADLFGGKHIVTAAMVLSTICSLLTPICARTSIVLMFVLRIVIGLAGGSVIPANWSMINAWSTPNERPLMIAVCSTGMFTGTIVTYLTSGLLCVHGFDNGWPSIFYIHGGITALFTCLWFLDMYSQPSNHPRMSEKELEHIQTSKGHAAKIKLPKTPWKRLILSKAMWASFIAHFCYDWSFFTVLINVPLFLKEVFKYDIESNGFYSAVPYVFQIISSLLFGKLSGIIIKRQIIGHLATRRLCTSISLLGIAVCLVLAGYMSCESRHIAVILLCFSCAFAGVSYGGFFANHPEYAGQFAGTALGITNSGGVISSILTSMMAGLLTPNGLREEWQIVLYIAAGFNVIGAIAFVLCSDVQLQPWARNREFDIIEDDATQEPEETRNKEHNHSHTT